MQADMVVAWNEEFQRICAQPAISTLERLRRSAAIRTLSQNFIQEVRIIHCVCLLFFLIDLRVPPLGHQMGQDHHQRVQSAR